MPNREAPELTAGSRHMARRNAVQALYQWLVTGQSPAEIEPGFISDQSFAGVDMAYFRQLISDVPRQQATIESRLQGHAERTLDSVDPVERAILLIGGYELLFRPDIPARVALDEAVQMAHIFGAEEGYRFINGVLDRLAADDPGQDATGSRR